MGRKKRRHKGRSARKRIQRIVATSTIQWIRLERKHVKLYRSEKRIAWRKSYHSHEKRAFVSLVGVKGKAQVKPGPVVYHLVRLVGDNWERKSFSTRSIKSTRIKGVHSPEYSIPTIGDSGTIAKDGTKSKVCRESRKLIVVGESVRFLGFSADDMLSLGIPRGKNGFRIGNGYIAVHLSLIGVDKLRQLQSVLSKTQF